MIVKKNKVNMIIKSVGFCLNTLAKYSCAWGIVIFVLALVSSGGVLIHAMVLEKMINTLTVSVKSSETVIYIILWISCVLAMNLFSLFKKYINIHIDADLEKGFLPVIIDKYNKIEYSYFENQNMQNLFQHVNSSSHKEIISILDVFISVLMSFITIIETIYIFTRSVWWLGLISSALTVPLVYLNIKAAYIEMKQRWTMTKDIRKRYYFQSLFADRNSLEEIKIFDSKSFFIGESDKLTQNINDDLKINIGRVTRLKALFTVIICLFSALVVILSSAMIIMHQIQLGTFVVLINSISVFVASEQTLSNSISSLVRVSENVNYITDFFALDNIADDNGKYENDKSDAIEVMNSIEFIHVYFSYPGCDNAVLKDLTFTVKRGEIASFVGVNGSGKSTIIKLICGLYKPNSGTILINGKDISLLSSEQIGRELSVVFQDGQHFMLSLRENIALGNIDSMNDDSRLTKALEIAGVNDKYGLKNGLDQHLGNIVEDAVELSGGEWQRILIARSFVGESSITLFDEPTSSLDPIGECKLYNTIYKYLLDSHKTSLLISHRLASCVFSDKIMVLRDGSIYESGTHAELMERGDYYAEMFKKQQSWYK